MEAWLRENHIKIERKYKEYNKKRVREKIEDSYIYS